MPSVPGKPGVIEKILPIRRTLISAKESVYTECFPLASHWLGFDEADISSDACGGRFSARLLAPAASR